jgi:hypothetical protein
MGGRTEWWGPKTLTYRCLDKHYTQEPFDFNSKVFVNRPTSTPFIYDYSPFTSTHAYCPVYSYGVDDNASGPLNAPAQVTTEPSCATASGALCRTLQLDVSTLGTYSFWVVPTARSTPTNGVRSWHRVDVTVGCGGENIAANPSSATRLYARDWVAPYTPYTESFWRPYFTNDLSAYCPTVKYEVFADEACTTPVDANITLNNGLTPTLSSFSVASGQPIWNKKFWVRGTTSGGRTALFDFTYSICGFETIEATTEARQERWYYAESPDRNQGLEWEFLDSFFQFELGPQSDPWCYD